MKVWLRFIIGIATVITSSWLSRLLPYGQQPVMKLILIVASLSFIRFSNGDFANYGFIRPKNVRWLQVLLPGILLGAGTALIALTFGLDGMQGLLKGYSLWQIVLVIWIWSSFSEEIFCRGWFQSGLPSGSWRQLWSAIFFGSMHLSLLWNGADLPSVLLIVCSTTVLGWLCATVRDQYSSWIPSFLRHFGFNAGALLGGIVYTIGFKILTGQFPPQ